MKNKLFKWGAVAVLAVLPYMAFAQPQTVWDSCTALGTQTTLASILCKLSVLINTIIPILIALGVVYFIWGVISYVVAGDDEAKTKGRDKMIYGLIGLLVIVSIWGLVNILKRSFGVDNDPTISVPCIKAPGVYCPD